MPLDTRKNWADTGRTGGTEVERLLKARWRKREKGGGTMRMKDRKRKGTKMNIHVVVRWSHRRSAMLVGVRWKMEGRGCKR